MKRNSLIKANYQRIMTNYQCNKAVKAVLLCFFLLLKKILKEGD